MGDGHKSFIHAFQQLSAAIFDISKGDKSQISSYEKSKAVTRSYDIILEHIGHVFFMNWGYWDRRLFQEYQAQNYDFSDIYPVSNIYSELLLYHLISPLINIDFYNKKLLDVGCGLGVGVKMMSRMLKTSYAVGIDLCHSAVKRATHHLYEKDQINYICGSSEVLPFETCSFDIITNLESSHLYDNLDNYFNEISRVLKPGGFFCYSDFNTTYKHQTTRLEAFVKNDPTLKIVIKRNITSKVQSSIYNRLVVNQNQMINLALSLFGNTEGDIRQQVQYFFRICGLFYLPRWRLWLCSDLLKECRSQYKKEGVKVHKHYFYYLVQKI